MDSSAKEVVQPMHTAEIKRPDMPKILNRDIRIALVGKTGVGKSSTANTICGKKLFKSGIKQSAKRQICQVVSTKVQGRSVMLIDTPGIFETVQTTTNDTEEEIKKCVQIGALGLTAFLFVFDITHIRNGDTNVISNFCKFFKNALHFVIIVFTHKDELEKEQINFEGVLSDAPESIKTLVHHCRNRVVLFNNDLSFGESYDQVSCLLYMVESLQKENQMKYYSGSVSEHSKFQSIQHYKSNESDEDNAKFTNVHGNNLTTSTNLERELEKHIEIKIQQALKEHEEKLEQFCDEMRKVMQENKESFQERSRCTII